MVIIVFGLPGSGKSYFASRLAADLEADYVNTDKIRKELFTRPSYSDEEKILVYKKLLDEVYHHAHAKKTIVVDGTFHKENVRNDFIKLSKDLNLHLRWIEVLAEESLIKERLSKKREFSDADYSVYKLLQQQHEPFDKQNQHQLIQLTSTNTNIGQMLEKAKKYLLDKNHS